MNAEHEEIGPMDLLTQARTTILNLRAVAFKAARMNRATTENMNDTSPPG